jgi:hypothetical protein
MSMSGNMAYEPCMHLRYIITPQARTARAEAERTLEPRDRGP